MVSNGQMERRQWAGMLLIRRLECSVEWRGGCDGVVIGRSP
jgi:hypothetical protein